jgi:hypothetical protein
MFKTKNKRKKIDGQITKKKEAKADGDEVTDWK